MLSRLIASVGVLAFATTLSGPLHAQEKGKMAMKAPPSKDATVTGTVVDVSCKFGQPTARAPDMRPSL
jgi:hypothetical protein